MITYAVSEEPVENYISTVEGFNITNSYSPEITEVSGQKYWNDGNDQDGLRPESITVNLLANGEVVDTQVVSAESDWAYSFTDLPRNANGEAIEYTISEEPVEGYTTEVEGFNIINSYTPEVTALTVTKEWDDADNQDGIRPESVEVQLFAGEDAVGSVVTLSEANQWIHTWNDLPKFAGGGEIQYSVRELTQVEGYTVSTRESAGQIILVNSHTPASRELTVNKVWKDNEDRAGRRPEAIQVQLLQDDELYGEAVELTEANGWTYTWADLPVMQNGEAVEYLVSEVTVPARYVSDVVVTDDVVTITNTYTPSGGGSESSSEESSSESSSDESESSSDEESESSSESSSGSKESVPPRGSDDETPSNDESDLPNTGEMTNTYLLVVIILALGSGLILLRPNKRNN